MHCFSCASFLRVKEQNNNDKWFRFARWKLTGQNLAWTDRSLRDRCNHLSWTCPDYKRVTDCRKRQESDGQCEKYIGKELKTKTLIDFAITKLSVYPPPHKNSRCLHDFYDKFAFVWSLTPSVTSILSPDEKFSDPVLCRLDFTGGGIGKNLLIQP